PRPAAGRPGRGAGPSGALQGRLVRRPPRIAATLAALAAGLALLAGCGSEEGDAPRQGVAVGGAEPPARVIVQTSAPGFNAARVYRRASPGVVTVRSIFPGTGAGEGSGFVLSRGGEIV